MDDGAHYHKTDLQVHTPRDPQWNGSRPVSDEDRAGYAKEFVAACRERGLRAVAITDHHDLAFVEYIREAAATESGPDGQTLEPRDRLVVFPGIELTLAVPCQAILILSAEFPPSHLARVLDVLSITPSDSAAAEADHPDRLPHFADLRELHKRLDENAWLKGEYIVLPNVSDGGHGTLMRAGMQQHYINMPCVGGYNDGDIGKQGDGNLRKFRGEDPAWGNKSLAVIQTSDARKSTFEELGTFPTWIKWATPTAEALRQACLAQESRIAHTAPLIPSVVITRLSVSNSRYMGPIELELNPQYNAIIGGRGTGKSTILEYLRWGLCDQPAEHLADDEMPDHAARRKRLIERTLADLGSHVEVHLLVNGIRHVVRRRADTGDVLLKVGDGDMRPATPNDVRGLLAVQAYSQKQLSSVGVRLDELTRFVTSPIVEELDSIRARENDLAARIRENFVTLQRKRALTRATTHDAVMVESLAQQATALREGLDSVAPEDRETLAQKPRFDSANELIEGWKRRLDEAQSAAEEYLRIVASARDGLKQVPDPGDSAVPHRDLVVAIEGAVSDELRVLEESASEAIERIAGTSATAGAAGLLETWHERRDEFEKQYAAAAERSTAHASKLEELAALEKRRTELQGALDRQRDELSRLDDAAARHDALRAEWRALQGERSAAIEAQCSALTDLSGGLIRAQVRRNAGLQELEDRLKAAVTGSGVRGNKIESFVRGIAENADPLKAWQGAMEQLEVAVLAHEHGSAGTINSGVLAPLSASDLEKMAARLKPETVLELCLIPMEDQPTFEYQTKESEYISFEVASAGQQATALLRVLLNQVGPPLIIDQPEDDLDSQVILSIVDQIWAAKRRRQIIFSSHNANLVVNGDAELVICCDYRASGDQSGGQVKLRGAIDIPSLRNEITKVMEGGEKAFRLRKEKYGF